MTQYVKFISENQIEFPPTNKDGIINYNLDIERLLADGYKKLIEVERPIPEDSYISYVNNTDNVTEVLNEPTPQQRLAAAKGIKQKENEDTCNGVRANSTFEITIQEKYCVFDTSAQTQADLQTAYMVTSTGAVYPNWVTNNWVKLDLTNADVLLIYTEFFNRVSPLYRIELYYTEKINACTTVEEVEAIEIDYTIDPPAQGE